MKNPVLYLSLMALVLFACAPQPGAETPTPPEPLATATPTLAPVDDPTPDIEATIVAGGGGEVLGVYPSPDGRWEVEVVTYDCAQIGGEEEIAFEQLFIVGRDTGERLRVASQLIYCGGLGAFGLQGLFWSPNSQYFYYTDAREGVPDGCGYWTKPFLRLDLSTGAIEAMGNGEVSPDGQRIAAWQEGVLTLWDVDEGPALLVPDQTLGAIPGPIAWSPDSRSFAFLMSESYCPVVTSYLHLYDLEGQNTIALQESSEPAFASVAWEGVGVLLLSDEAGDTWSYDLESGQLKPSTP